MSEDGRGVGPGLGHTALVSGAVLVVAYGIAAFATLGGTDDAACTGIGFGCRPSGGFLLALVVLPTLAGWGVLLALVPWVRRLSSRFGPSGFAGRVLAAAPVVFALGVLGWAVLILLG